MSRFPLVFAPSGDHSLSVITRQLEEILERQTPFVLITDHHPDDHEDETKEERREKAFLFKKVKSGFMKYCRGMIVIEGDRRITPAMRLAASGVSKALGLAVRFVPDEASAITSGEEILKTSAAET